VPMRLCCLILLLAHLPQADLAAQATTTSPPRVLSAKLTGCDSLQKAPGDSVYHADAVDQPVRPRRLTVGRMPLRLGHVMRGHTTLRFIVDRYGRIDRCSIVLLEEVAPEWTDAVVRELRSVRYQPARRAGEHVRQWVEQLFTYHHDGRS
jgi:hypothetical protein